MIVGCKLADLPKCLHAIFCAYLGLENAHGALG
jgi:hypothetical protein